MTSASIAISSQPTEYRIDPIFSLRKVDMSKWYLRQPRSETNTATPLQYPLLGLLDEKIKSIEIMINKLKTRQENWDFRGSLKPQEKSISVSKNLLIDIFTIADNEKYDLTLPLISSDEYGDIISEWWMGDKKLTLDFTSNEINCTKIDNIDGTPQFDVSSLSKKDIRPVLDWFFLGE